MLGMAEVHLNYCKLSSNPKLTAVPVQLPADSASVQI
jgi:hypothetical protein